MITEREFKEYGFVEYQCEYTKEWFYTFKCDAYHIRVTKEIYGSIKDDDVLGRHACHIDGSDCSTIGFAYVKNISDICAVLVATGEKPLKKV